MNSMPSLHSHSPLEFCAVPISHTHAVPSKYARLYPAHASHHRPFGPYRPAGQSAHTGEPALTPSRYWPILHVSVAVIQSYTVKFTFLRHDTTFAHTVSDRLVQLNTTFPVQFEHTEHTGGSLFTHPADKYVPFLQIGQIAQMLSWLSCPR